MKIIAQNPLMLNLYVFKMTNRLDKGYYSRVNVNKFALLG